MLSMELLLGTVILRPYVFAFVGLFVAAAARDLGWRRMALFGAIVWPLAWLSEFSSTRTGIPFGFYVYTGATHGRELYIADVPFMDALSFTFLAYASFCLARAALAGRAAAPWAHALTTGVLMMALDVVVDPLAVLGDRWFLGRIFYYPAGGHYFGVPLSNFAGWVLVGALGTAAFLALAGPVRSPRVWPGVGLYYVVLGFNLTVTAWIGEWLLFAVGLSVHVAIAATLRYLRAEPRTARAVPSGGVQRA
jgi:uncharacterized membrane protein